MTKLLFLGCATLVGMSLMANTQPSRRMHTIWEEMDELMEQQRKLVWEGFNQASRFDQNLVKTSEIKMPDIKVETRDHEVKITVGQLTVPKKDISVTHEDDHVRVVFPSGKDRITMVITPHMLQVVAEQEVREEKKNDKEEVISKAAFAAYSQHVVTLPHVIDLHQIAPEYKDDKLVLTFGQKNNKRAIEIK